MSRLFCIGQYSQIRRPTFQMVPNSVLEIIQQLFPVDG